MQREAHVRRQGQREAATGRDAVDARDDLPNHLRKKLFAYSLQEWGVNQGMDPYDVIKSHRLPTALSHSILSAVYSDVVDESPMLRQIDNPVLNELLKYMKVVISLQRETLIHQSDPCTRVYFLRAGSLQASASDRLQAAANGTAAPPGRASKANRSSAWKQKMQVRMIEAPGSVICCASPYEAPCPLPFVVTSLKRSTLIALHMQDLLTVLEQVAESQVDLIVKSMRAEHQSILVSVQPKQNARNTKADAHRESTDIYGDAGSPGAVFGDKDNRDLSDRRLLALEHEIDRCVRHMGDLHSKAKSIPRMVAALSKMQGKPMPTSLPKAAAAAIGAGTDVGSDSEINELRKEMGMDDG